MKEYLKEHRKMLKSVQMDLVTNFIKYEVESSSNYDDSGGR